MRGKGWDWLGLTGGLGCAGSGRGRGTGGGGEGRGRSCACYTVRYLGGLTRGAGLPLGVPCAWKEASEGGLGGSEAACQFVFLGIVVLARAPLVGAGLVGGRVVVEADVLGDVVDVVS